MTHMRSIQLSPGAVLLLLCVSLLTAGTSERLQDATERNAVSPATSTHILATPRDGDQDGDVPLCC